MFENKKILVIAPKFMNYEVEIVHKLETMGAEVFFFNQRSVTSGLGRALSKKIPRAFKFYNINHYNKLFKLIPFTPDEILIIQGDMLEKNTISKFKKIWPNAKLSLYLWDNLKNVHGVEKKISWFDRAFTFDEVDSKKNNSLIFLPLFFVDKFALKEKQKILYDISFIGTIHSDRHKVLSEIKLCLSDNIKNKRFFLFEFLQTEWIFWLYKVFKRSFKKAQKKEFHFQPLNLNEVEKIQSASFAIIDIQHPKQSGLTIRTIEIMAMGKKLITTNPNIEHYPFYNKNNILIVDREAVKIPESFFESPFQPIDKNIIEQLSIESWLKTILS